MSGRYFAALESRAWIPVTVAATRWRLALGSLESRCLVHPQLRAGCLELRADPVTQLCFWVTTFGEIQLTNK